MPEVLIDGVKYTPESIAEKQEAAYGILGRAPFFSSRENRDFLIAEFSKAQARIADLESEHPEWMERIKRERQEEREVLWKEMKAHRHGDMGPAHVFVNEIEYLFKR